MPAFRLFDTLTRTEQPQRPPQEGKPFSVYSCGPTVYRYVHLGNLRSFLLADLVCRVAEYLGHRVFQVMNITDVGHLENERLEEGRDKLLVAAEVEGKSPDEIAEFYTSAFFDDIAALGIRPADAYPRASRHIPQMIELIEELLKKGHAYESGGNVYFDVASFPGYGKLSGNTLDALRAGHRMHTHDTNKRRPEDFLLWRKAGPGRILKFSSPFGEGFPGWHIECSAMSLCYLGPDIDVHTGGADLVFPHHESEIAQSEAAVGKKVVRTWVHGAHLLFSGQKMAKSKLNDLRITALEERGIDPLAFRYLCFGARYRKQLNFSWESLEGADRALTKLRRQAATFASRNPDPGGAEVEHWDTRFAAAVGGDLDMPKALELLHAMVGDARTPPEAKAYLLRKWDSVLGLDLTRHSEVRPPDDDSTQPVSRPDEELVQRLVQERDEARRRRDYAAADAIRKRLGDLGVELVDTPEGTLTKMAAGLQRPTSPGCDRR